MATQNSTTTSGYILGRADASLYSWSQARSGTGTSNVAYVNPTTIRAGAYEIISGTFNHNFMRIFQAFDLSSVVGNITSLDLVLTTNTAVGIVTDFIITKASKPSISTNLVAADFASLDFNTLYTSNFSLTASTTNTVALNSTAISDANSNSELILSIINYDYDYLDTMPVPSSATYMNIQNASGTRPYLSYTAVTGYGNTVTGIIPANIGKVNNVATANIGNIIGI